MHHRLAERLAAETLKLLNAKVAMECVNIERLCWLEFLSGLKNSLFLCLVSMSPLECGLILEIRSEIALQIVSKLLNDTSSTGKTVPPRPLTDVEQIALMQFVNPVLNIFATKWKKVYRQVDIQFSALVDSVRNFPKSYPKGTTLLADIELQM